MKKEELEKMTDKELHNLKESLYTKLALNNFDGRTKEFKIYEMIDRIKYERWCASGEKDKPIEVIVR